MIIRSQQAETDAVLSAAKAIAAAARTAPKACGVDHTDTLILTGEDKDALAAKMREIGERLGNDFFVRDAGNVDAAQALVLIGARYEPRGLGAMCGICGFDDCAAAQKAGAACAFTAMDLGIALGSAVALAADLRVDNRMMFTAGKAAAELGLLGEHKMVIGVPLSVSGKNPFFDRSRIDG